jgi:predicted nucleic acid-binding protein
LVRDGAISARRADEGVQDLLGLRIARYPHFVFLPRIWRYRNNLSAYGAAYVALAQELCATLITRDGRLASATGHQATIELF